MPFNILHFEKFLPHKAIELSIAATSPGMAAFVISHGGEVRSLPRPKLVRTNPTTRTATAFIAFQHLSSSNGVTSPSPTAPRNWPRPHNVLRNILPPSTVSPITTSLLRQPCHSDRLITPFILEGCKGPYREGWTIESSSL